MTQEDEELLIKDLCARLPYGVKISKTIDDFISEPKLIKSLYPNGTILVEDEFPDVDAWDICEIKPYLRPMSSMTDEEKKEYEETFASVYDVDDYGEDADSWHEEFSINSVDWLNSHHFDYRGLIEKGLALEALEGMYK